MTMAVLGLKENDDDVLSAKKRIKQGKKFFSYQSKMNYRVNCSLTKRQSQVYRCDGMFLYLDKERKVVAFVDQLRS